LGFQGGFKPNGTNRGRAFCGARWAGLSRVFDYSPHHEPFHYYAQTANPGHLPLSAPDKVGYTESSI
jgi:phospholipase C